MTMFFDERAALKMTLETVLKQRQELRASYVDQDRALSLETKQIIKRISELDEAIISSGKPLPVNLVSTIAHSEVAVATVTESSDAAAEQNDVELQQSSQKITRKYISIDYPRIKRCIEEILTKSYIPISMKDVAGALEGRYEIELTNYNITIPKIVKEMPKVEVSKQGRNLYFMWKQD